MLLLSVLFAASLMLAWWAQMRRLKATKTPPVPFYAFPFLGHAIQYKRDPPRFLERCREACGPVFTIDLAGLVVTLVTDEASMKCVATGTRETVSASAAVADFGFAYTLGNLNVMHGTLLHKLALKASVYPSLDASCLASFVEAGVNSALVETAKPITAGCGRVDDLMGAVRWAALHATVSHLICPSIIEAYGQSPRTLMDDFMELQDCIEDSTAKGVLLPHLVARWMVWGPVQRARVRFTRRLTSALSNVLRSEGKRGLALKDGGTPGPWLRFMLQDSRDAGGPKSLEDIADLIVGLLFAAHKNPAIAAAQTLIFILTEGCQKAALGAPEEPGAKTCSTTIEDAVRHDIEYLGIVGAASKSSILDSCVHETLRLTAHSIGAIRKVVSESGLAVKAGGNCPNVIVPCGQYVGISHALPHRNAAVFGSDATSWRPSRGTASLQNRPYTLTTFSHGIHMCPGQSYALLFVKLLVAKFLCDPLSRAAPGILTLDAQVDFTRATLAQRNKKVACDVLLRQHSTR